MPEKILLIDDETKITRTLQLYLEQAGYKTASINDGALALPAFHHEKPDLVILDILLPHLDGWEICRQIRRESKELVSDERVQEANFAAEVRAFSK